MRGRTFPITVVLVLLAAPPAHAQWLPNGNDIYYDAGLVAIGVSASISGAQLHVETNKAGTGIYSANFTSGGTPRAIWGYTTAVNGIGVEGFASADTGNTYGVYGNSSSADGAGVFGRASGDTKGIGVWALGQGKVAHGVRAEAMGSGYGVYASSGSSDAVLATTALGHAAVHAFAYSKTAAGVIGESRGSEGIGVRGIQGLPQGAAPPAGVVGEGSGREAYGVFSVGDFGGTGAKYFVQPHPTDPSLAVRFVCLEGNESGTYFRGTSRLVAGRAEIEIPDAWRHVSEEAGITVQVTPIRSLARLTVWEKSRERIVIAGDQDCEFDYFVNGVRRGFADYRPTVANRYFRPAVRGEPFGKQYPEALRQILVENGTLHSDFTPNEATAARLGWDLQSAAESHHE